MQDINRLRMHHTSSFCLNHFSFSVSFGVFLCSLLTRPNPFSPSSVCPRSFSALFHLTFFSHRRIKQIVSFSSLLHTSPQHMTLPYLFLTAFIPSPTGIHASVPPLLPPPSPSHLLPVSPSLCPSKSLYSCCSSIRPSFLPFLFSGVFVFFF